MFSRDDSGRLWAELDDLERVALDAAVAEAGLGCGAAAVAPARRLVAASASGAVRVGDTDRVALRAALASTRGYLAETLSLLGLDPGEQAQYAAALAVDGPVRVPARAFLWLGMLIAELDAVT